MIHPISKVAECNFIKHEELLAFVKSDKCPPDVILHDGCNDDDPDPITNTWYVDKLIKAFYENGGKRMTHDEIVAKYRSEKTS